MLRITVELWPGGRSEHKKVIATADIGRIKDGAEADYEVLLREQGEDIGDIATVTRYPRWSASIWDLVARGIAAALNSGREELPTRPTPPIVPIHRDDGMPYIRMSEIPEPAQSAFRRNVAHSGRPVINEDPTPHDCAFVHDWQDFLTGVR